tara:strand:- start:346 stop:1278 length:933 start_codon:yes stop_codon:yes gene_type:complete
MAKVFSELQTRSIPRRSFLSGAGCALLLSSCSTTQGEVDKDPTSIDKVQFLQAGFADGFTMPSTLVAGKPQRAPFFIYGSNGLPVVNNLPSEIIGELVLPSGSAEEVSLPQYNEGIPTPYFLLEFEIPEDDQGICQLKIDSQGLSQVVEFRVISQLETDLIQVGETMRIAGTPTFADSAGFDPLCTRPEPCLFHEVNLKDALANNRPTILLVSTPGFCQTSICGPVLELLIELPKNSNWDVIHAEVYTEPKKIAEGTDLQKLISPVIQTYGMNFEPCFIVAGSDNKVLARLDYAFDKSEMRKALDYLLLG